jgi:hypothetical protein
MSHLQGKGIIIARSPGKDLKRKRGEAEPTRFLGTPESESPFSFATQPTLLPVIDCDSARLLPLRNTHLCDEGPPVDRDVASLLGSDATQFGRRLLNAAALFLNDSLTDLISFSWPPFIPMIFIYEMISA